MPSFTLKTSSLLCAAICILWVTAWMWNAQRSLPVSTRQIMTTTTPILDGGEFAQKDERRIVHVDAGGNNTTTKTGFQFCTQKQLYHCEGKEYDQFVHKLHDYIENIDLQGPEERGELWGHREYPAPANSTYLFVGNSHLRQTFLSLVCPYLNDNVTTEVDAYANFYKYTFPNNATLFLFSNTHVVYTKRWKEMLEEYIGFPLALLDGIILGSIHKVQNTKHTDFARDMMNKTSDPNSDFDFKGTPPPEVEDFKKAFNGPVLSVGMFSENTETFWTKDVDHPSGYGSLNGRYHIDKIGLECGAPSKYGNNNCVNINRPRVRSMHRCTGNGGGHPSLLAWDVVEQIFQHM